MAAFTAAGIATLTDARAQQPPDGADRPTAPAAQGTLEEVFVTARKRNESLTDAPLAVQVLDKEALARYDTSDITSIGLMAPQVMLLPAPTGSGAVLTVRGIAAAPNDPGVDTSVAFNIDGVGITRGRIVRQGLFDLESVEVLKGPQALFFGKNAPAGVVTVRSAAPTGSWEFSANGGYEFEADEATTEAIVSGPVSDTLGMRLAYHYGQAEGYLKNVAKPQAPRPEIYPGPPVAFPGALDSRLGGYEEHLARLTLAYEPTENLAATMKVLGGWTWLDSTGGMVEPTRCPGPVPTSAGLPDPDGDCELNGVVSVGALPLDVTRNFAGLAYQKDGRSDNSVNSILSSINIDYTLGSFVFTSLTGFYDYRSFRFDGFDGTTWNRRGAGVEREEFQQLSQEFRLLSTFDSPVNFLLGGYVEDTARTTRAAAYIVPAAPDPVTGTYESFDGRAEVDGRSYNIFGQGIWNVTSAIELAAGARWSSEERDGHLVLRHTNSNIPPGRFRPIGDPIEPRYRDNEISPEATLRWKMTPNSAIYAAFKSGYKSGSFATQPTFPPGDTAESIIYEAESAQGGELGFKTASGSLRASVTAYLYDFDDIQDSILNPATSTFEHRNADVRTKGVEAEADYQLTANLSLRGNLAYNDARYRRYPDSPCWQGQTIALGCTPGAPGTLGFQDISGRRRFLAPAWVGSAGLTYWTPLGSDLRLELSSDVYYTDSYYTTVVLNPWGVQEAVTRFNLAVKLGHMDGQWDLSLIGENLSDERWVGLGTQRTNGTVGDLAGFSMPGRQVRVEAAFNF